MFSGIVESIGQILKIAPGQKSFQIWVARPKEFNDLEVGDSIAIDGVCLTAERFDDALIQFTVGLETMTLLGWTPKILENKIVNLERSLEFGSRVHGHLVTGHVDALGEVVKVDLQGDCLILGIQIPVECQGYVWKKGSLTVNGVSLTVNSVVEGVIELCLVPETLRRTNLKELKVNQYVNIETDYLAKCFLHSKTQGLWSSSPAEVQNEI